MCIILPVLHVSCSHTVAIWQHCPKATPTGPKDKKSCMNARQHERPILTRRLCEACSGERTFSRRGGVAERGSGALTNIPETDTKSEGDSSAADSGYHSDIIYEEDECSNFSDRSLSPKTVAPRRAQTQRKHNSTGHRSLARKHSWKPNLKRDLSLERGPVRRDSIDSFLGHIDDTIKETLLVPGPTTSTTMERKTRRSTTPNPHTDPRKRYSTLLHPSPPEATKTSQAQFAVAFSAPQIVTVRRPTSLQVVPHSHSRKGSTLLHPSSPTDDKSVRRKTSSLLHPSITTTTTTHTAHPATIISIPPHEISVKNVRRKTSSLLHPSSTPVTSTLNALPRTIISVPPQHAPRPKLGRTSSLLWRAGVLDGGVGCMAVSGKVSGMVGEMVGEGEGRRVSVLHSCFSDEEDEN